MFDLTGHLDLCGPYIMCLFLILQTLGPFFCPWYPSFGPLAPPPISSASRYIVHFCRSHSCKNIPHSTCRSHPAVPARSTVHPTYHRCQSIRLQTCPLSPDGKNDASLPSHYKKSGILLVVRVIRRTKKKPSDSWDLHGHHHRTHGRRCTWGIPDLNWHSEATAKITQCQWVRVARDRGGQHLVASLDGPLRREAEDAQLFNILRQFSEHCHDCLPEPTKTRLRQQALGTFDGSSCSVNFSNSLNVHGFYFPIIGLGGYEY